MSSWRLVGQKLVDQAGDVAAVCVACREPSCFVLKLKRRVSFCSTMSISQAHTNCTEIGAHHCSFDIDLLPRWSKCLVAPTVGSHQFLQTPRDLTSLQPFKASSSVLKKPFDSLDPHICTQHSDPDNA